MADIPLVQLPYPEEETRTFELSTSLSPNWDKNGRIYYTDETGQVVRPQTKYNPLQMLGRRLKAFGSNAKNFVEDFNMDKSHTYFAPFEDINEQYKAGNIDKSELPYLAQGRAEQEIRDAQQQEKDNINRGWLGTGLSAASMHPIFNIPYVGTGLGGAMYDLGQGITEGDTADELWDRTKRGFAIGESVGAILGAIPYVGKLAGKTKPGQAVGSALNKAGEKFANAKLYDALMTDIKGFNPFKQTGYHGSPYNFNKFSNEAIGTGEGAQAHGLGHYSALNKNIAEGYRKRLSESLHNEKIQSRLWSDLKNNRIPQLKDNEEKELFEYIANNITPSEFNAEHLKNYFFKDLETPEAKEFAKNLLANMAENNNIKTGQLYKLSIPKDDVMLREDELLSTQPNIAKIWDEVRLDRVNKATTSLPKFKMALAANDIDIQKAFNTRYFEDALEKARNNPEKYKDLFLNQEMTGKHLYGYLENILGSRKAANEYLQQRGIKGISYNGGIDGEARVIFNPDDIEIIRKYYNQPGLFEQLTGASNSGAAVDSLYNKITR